jgi:transcriptional regulator with XRE-family HTH domain
VKQRRRSPTPFAKILSSLLHEKNIGVREAAKLAGVGASTIMSWKSGALPEDYLAVKRLAENLGTTLSFMLTGENDSRPNNPPNVTEVFEDGGSLFDGYAKIQIQRLIPKTKKEGG